MVVWCPFRTVEVMQEFMTYIDDSKYVIPSWLKKKARCWLACYWKEMMDLKCVWTEPDSSGHIQWMHYRQRLIDGKLDIRCIPYTDRIRQIPHWESYCSRHRFTAVIFSNMDQLVETSLDNDELFARYAGLRLELTKQMVPAWFIDKEIRRYFVNRRQKLHQSQVVPDDYDDDTETKTITTVTDYSDAFDVSKFRRTTKATMDGLELRTAVRSHLEIGDILKGISRREQPERYRHCRSFLCPEKDETYVRALANARIPIRPAGTF